jgi:hypothetical protein
MINIKPTALPTTLEEALLSAWKWEQKIKKQ